MISFFKNTIFVMTSLSFIGMLGGCARNISSDTYHDLTVGEAAHTYKGIIINARSVMVAPEQLDSNVLGAGLGGVAGGVAGHQFGKGHGNVAATAAGALAGIFAGALIENEMRTQNAIEYIVQLQDGEIRTIVQGPEPVYAAGQRVFLMVTHRGRSRLIPDNTNY